MKKILMTLVIVVSFSVLAQAADLSICYNIPSGKVNEYITNYIYINPNNEVDVNGDKIYTDKQWVKEHILREVRKEIVQGRNNKYDNAKTPYKADGIN